MYLKTRKHIEKDLSFNLSHKARTYIANLTFNNAKICGVNTDVTP